MRTFDIHLVIGNTQIILKGAEEYHIQELPTQPQITAKAPKGGRTVYTRTRGSNYKGKEDNAIVAAVTIHEVVNEEEADSDQMALGDGKQQEDDISDE